MDNSSGALSNIYLNPSEVLSVLVFAQPKSGKLFLRQNLASWWLSISVSGREEIKKSALGQLRKEWKGFVFGSLSICFWDAAHWLVVSYTPCTNFQVVNRRIKQYFQQNAAHQDPFQGHPQLSCFSLLSCSFWFLWPENIDTYSELNSFEQKLHGKRKLIDEAVIFTTWRLRGCSTLKTKVGQDVYFPGKLLPISIGFSNYLFAQKYFWFWEDFKICYRFEQSTRMFSVGFKFGHKSRKTYFTNSILKWPKETLLFLAA